MPYLTDCLVESHDLALAASAVAVCGLTAVVTFALHARQGRSGEAFRPALLALMATVASVGTWTTHIVAMLAYRTAVPVSYDWGLTALSLALTLPTLGGGLVLAALARGTAGRALGGALAGAGIGTMHYAGIAAMSLQGTWEHAAGGIAGSLVAGILLAAAALALAGDGGRASRSVAGAVAFAAAVASLHFTGMATLTVRHDPAVAYAETGLTTGMLSGFAVAATLLLLALAAAAARVERLSAGEGQRRVRELAEAAMEGIAFARDGRVEEANAAFLALAGLPAPQARGSLLSRLFPAGLPGPGRGAMETDMRTLDGTPVPVSVLCRESGAPGTGRTVLVVRDLRQQREAEARIRFLAHNDALTGLANRVTFGEALAHALSPGAPGATLLCLDLDRFKAVNDTMGHAAGDALLREVAARLAACVGGLGLACRLGGDEFTVLLPAAGDPRVAEELAARVVAELSRPYEIEGRPASVGASVGIATAPGDGADPESLVRAADAALYAAKTGGRGRWVRFDSAMAEARRTRGTMGADLAVALARGELALHYQPVFDLRTGETLGHEALMRWDSPVHGQVPPTLFIPLAEEVGAMVAIGDWSLRRACADAASWECGSPVAVNLSPVHFRSSGLVDAVASALSESGLDPDRLQVEVTEAVLLRDGAAAMATLRRLKEIGVTVSMDDFGTGYSSLGYLRSVPFDRIKVDGSFVRDVTTSPEALGIVRAVARLGATLGLPVVAEGIETQEQAECLRREGCTEGQGFLLGRPLPGPPAAAPWGPRQAAMAAA